MAGTPVSPLAVALWRSEVDLQLEDFHSSFLRSPAGLLSWATNQPIRTISVTRAQWYPGPIVGFWPVVKA
jgi:hypothetical protein